MSNTKSSSRPGPHRISIFNHKGGVAKTTLTHNIGAALVELGYKVLLVDADPQCNLTTLLVEWPVVDDLLDHSEDSTGKTIWSAVKPISEALGGVQIVKPIELSKEGLYLIPGDIRLSQFEADLNDFWSQCLQRKTKGFRGTTAISDLITEVSKTYEIDYVLYDSGPNVGPLNRAIVLDCDYIVIPLACDLFSLRALKTLGRTLFDWITSWNTIAELAPTGTTLLPGKPIFLGYIPQGFRVYGEVVSQGQSHFLAKIDKEIFSQITAVLRRIDPLLASPKRKSFKLGEVKHFGALISASQKDGLPLWEVDAGSQKQRSDARKSLMAIAKSIDSVV